MLDMACNIYIDSPFDALPRNIETYSSSYSIDYEAPASFIILPRMSDEDRQFGVFI